MSGKGLSVRVPGIDVGLVGVVGLLAPPPLVPPDPDDLGHKLRWEIKGFQG